MASKGKNRGIILSDAWRTYWRELFADGTSAEDDLAETIKNRVVALDFEPPSGFGVPIEEPLPAWSEKLSIGVEDLDVTMGLEGYEPKSCGLFLQTMTTDNPLWKNNHPFEQLVSGRLNARTAVQRWDKDCHQILVQAVQCVCTEIDSKLKEAIAAGHLEVFGKPPGNPFADLQPMGRSSLQGTLSIGVHDNTISLGTNNVQINDVHLGVPASAQNSESHGNSFADNDQRMFQEMERLLSSGEASSVAQAARMMAPSAKRRPGAGDDSVIDRLQRGYSRYTREKNL